MHPETLNGKRIAIWGMGREGLAVETLIRDHVQNPSLIFLDESAVNPTPATPTSNTPVVRGIDAIAQALANIDVVVKSPGVPLYHAALIPFIQRGGVVTSLINLWMAAKPAHIQTVCVTGTKGKSTTSAIIHHILQKTGHRSALAGNIGVAISQVDVHATDIVIIEMSSYQTANFDGMCDIAVMTSLYPEHLDWHGSLAQYYHDKCNILAHARRQIASSQSIHVMDAHGIPTANIGIVGEETGIHVKNRIIHDGSRIIGPIDNAYLAHAHNAHNVCLALQATAALGIDPVAALASLHDFTGLPHRQYELGTQSGILYVDDSISTTPQSAIAALQSYTGRDVTILIGGYDRGIDYTPLIDYLCAHPCAGVVCMGQSGPRLHAALQHAGYRNKTATSFDMPSALHHAREFTPAGGVILLSPAAPSYDQYRDFIHRGHVFAEVSGFAVIDDNQR